MFHSLTFPSNFTSAATPAFRCRAAVATPPPKQAAPPRKRTPGSLYEVLRVKHNASKLEIKSAYRSLAKIYHPDVTPASSIETDECDFLQIHSAYETLSDPAARAVYDLSLGSSTRYNAAASFRGYSSGRRRPTRRWETDQCW
ncbi:hypothetical protein RND81_09G202600 [Saponaria officinalis]|uniref:J domain-containing protein n=1 Tax=Saponaria officinalis TaxID=3572 RepID=A0AAW1IQA8_SAPOF